MEKFIKKHNFCLKIKITYAIVRIITETGGKMNRYRQLANQRGQTLVEFALMLVVSALIAGALELCFLIFFKVFASILTFSCFSDLDFMFTL